MEFSDFATRLLAAIAAGLIIGMERQINHKIAGLRTHTLVALGSAVFVLISFELTNSGGGDVTRIIGQVATGIGFLGAGVIIHQGMTVHGLTTAATIWCSASLGSLAAAGYYKEAGLGAGLVVLINFALHHVDEWIERKQKKQIGL